MLDFTPNTQPACIALGSNIGDREACLRAAIDCIHNHPGIQVKACSSVYETDPVGYVEQAPFLNMVIFVACQLAPTELMTSLLEIERRLGRVREIPWGPRTIDLDLLWFNNIKMDTQILTLPHPRMMDRAFVLVPLAELKECQELEGLESIPFHLGKLDGKEGVRLWKKRIWPSE